MGAQGNWTNGIQALLPMDSVVAELGHRAVVEMLLVGLAHGPSLQLMNSITAGVELTMARDLSQFSSVLPLVPLVGVSPGQELAGRTCLAGGIGRQGDLDGGIGRGGVSHHTDP